MNRLNFNYPYMMAMQLAEISRLILRNICGECPPRFSWGSANLVDPNETRQGYVTALRAADAHDLEPLIAFARS